MPRLFVARHRFESRKSERSAAHLHLDRLAAPKRPGFRRRKQHPAPLSRVSEGEVGPSERNERAEVSLAARHPRHRRAACDRCRAIQHRVCQQNYRPEHVRPHEPQRDERGAIECHDGLMARREAPPDPFAHGEARGHDGQRDARPGDGPFRRTGGDAIALLGIERPGAERRREGGAAGIAGEQAPHHRLPPAARFCASAALVRASPIMRSARALFGSSCSALSKHSAACRQRLAPW